MVQISGKSDSQKLFSVKQVAEIFDASLNVIYRSIKSGDLFVILIPGTGKRPIMKIHANDLDKWFNDHRFDLSPGWVLVYSVGSPKSEKHTPGGAEC